MTTQNPSCYIPPSQEDGGVHADPSGLIPPPPAPPPAPVRTVGHERYFPDYHATLAVPVMELVYMPPGPAQTGFGARGEQGSGSERNGAICVRCR